MYTAGLNNDVMSWNQLQGDASIVSFHGGFTQHFRQSRDTVSVRTWLHDCLLLPASSTRTYMHVWPHRTPHRPFTTNTQWTNNRATHSSMKRASSVNDVCVVPHVTNARDVIYSSMNQVHHGYVTTEV